MLVHIFGYLFLFIILVILDVFIIVINALLFLSSIKSLSSYYLSILFITLSFTKWSKSYVHLLLFSLANSGIKSKVAPVSNSNFKINKFLNKNHKILLSKLMMGIVVKIAFLFVLVSISSQIAYSIPFILLHGIGDECKSEGVSTFTKVLSHYSGVEGYCLEIGNGFMDSWFLPMQKQSSLACEKVKKMKELAGGYNIVGLSQGNLIARGLIEFCDGGPPIKNYISLGGPHAGVASVPLCERNFCQIASDLIKVGVYTDFVQNHLAPSGYLKIPTDINAYMNKSRYLPQLNNERLHERNPTYKKRFSSLQNLILIMSDQDNVLVPRETSWFGYYPDGAFEPVLTVKQTPLYNEDWIGLKTLEDAGRVKYVTVEGGHLGISDDNMKKFMVPYLANEKNASKLDEEENVPSFSGRFASAWEIGANETDDDVMRSPFRLVAIEE